MSAVPLRREARIHRVVCLLEILALKKPRIADYLFDFVDTYLEPFLTDEEFRLADEPAGKEWLQ